MTYQETEKYIFEKLPMFQNIGGQAYKPTLENTENLCAFLGNPQKKLTFIHIAGTNGKGSVSHSLASIWQTAGYKVGLFTSPHLKTYRERICINGEMISENDVIALVETLKPKIEEISPSFFEATTAMAFAYFAKKNVDIVILETGMGGRLDATNIVTPILSVITNISYDHQKFLGDTLPQIAGEKAGIIKPNVPVVIGEYHAETLPVFVEKAQKENATLYKAWENFEAKFVGEDGEDIAISSLNNNLSTQNKNKFIDLLTLWGREGLLKGIYQLKNFATIAQVLQILAKEWHITPEICKHALENVTHITHLKGRWQILHEKPFIVCDTAHNESGFEQLFKQFAKTIVLKHIQHIVLILGFAKDKNYIEILKNIQNFFADYRLNILYYFTSFPLERALPAEMLAQEAKKQLGIDGQTFATVKDALDFAVQDFSIKTVENTFIFVGGSNFIVAEVPNL